MSDDPSLDGAYNLSTAEDHRKLYQTWAETYDVTFGAAMDYQQPVSVAKTFERAGGRGPVLDMGAGTGLVGEALSELGIEPVDATDLSAEMLAVAERKEVYRNLIEADILKGLPISDGTYNGVTCAGTFTHGHLGPEILPELLRVCASGAVFSISINAEFYRRAGFEAAFRDLSDRIEGLNMIERRIYGREAAGDHADDTSFFTTFRKR